MKTNNLFLLLALAVSLVSCKEDEITILGQVRVRSFFGPEDKQEPIAGIPVSIFLEMENNSIESTPIAEQKLMHRCKTDKNGYYHFTIKESEWLTLDSYNAYLVKSTAFDSTKVEWQYFSDSTIAKAFNGPETEHFSQAIGHSLNPGHGFRLLPAGWVYFKFENLTQQSITISNGFDYSRYYKANGSSNNTFLFLHPSKVNEIKIDSYGIDNVCIGSGFINLYVRNSFVRSSRPWNESIKPDTVIIDMSTMAHRVIKADLE